MAADVNSPYDVLGINWKMASENIKKKYMFSSVKLVCLFLFIFLLISLLFRSILPSCLSSPSVLEKKRMRKLKYKSYGYEKIQRIMQCTRISGRTCTMTILF
jgi:hypothetical protein